MTIRRFDGLKDKNQWDEFVGKAKNQTFLFYRDFMDYHADRFDDHSCIILNDKEAIVGLLPANRSRKNPHTVISHEGLTYGGLIVPHDVKVKSVISYLHAVLSYLHTEGMEWLQLKQFPAFYNQNATDELEYALFLAEATLYRRDVAMVIDYRNKIPYTGNIRREGNKAAKAGAVLQEKETMDDFWTTVLEPNLKARFNVKPVHSLEEINLLKARFPQQVRQFDIILENEVVAGATMFVTNGVAHCQYISANEKGRKSGALNYLFMELIDSVFHNCRYFDFGIVNENNGKFINEGMLFWKESFGGRAQRHDFYQVSTSAYKLLEKYL